MFLFSPVLALLHLHAQIIPACTHTSGAIALLVYLCITSHIHTAQMPPCTPGPPRADVYEGHSPIPYRNGLGSCASHTRRPCERPNTCVGATRPRCVSPSNVFARDSTLMLVAKHKRYFKRHALQHCPSFLGASTFYSSKCGLQATRYHPCTHLSSIPPSCLTNTNPSIHPKFLTAKASCTRQLIWWASGSGGPH